MSALALVKCIVTQRGDETINRSLQIDLFFSLNQLLSKTVSAQHEHYEPGEGRIYCKICALDCNISASRTS